jgi:hypothetical protein
VAEAEATRRRLGPGGIDLVLARINLTPDQAHEGYALAQRWRAQESTLPVILIGGDPSLQALPDIHAGAMRLLPNPRTWMACSSPCGRSSAGKPPSARVSAWWPTPRLSIPNLRGLDPQRAGRQQGGICDGKAEHTRRSNSTSTSAPNSAPAVALSN